MTDSPDAATELGDDGAGFRAAFFKALHDDFAAHGVAAIVAYREEKPADYLKVIAAILPKDGGGGADGAHASPETMSDDELLARIRALDQSINSVLGRVRGAEGGAPSPADDAPPSALPPLP